MGPVRHGAAVARHAPQATQRHGLSCRAMSILQPPALRSGDPVMLISPAGPPSADRVARGTELLSGWGLTVILGPNVYGRHSFFAGTDAQRLASLNAALRDPAVRAVVCTRGG